VLAAGSPGTGEAWRRWSWRSAPRCWDWVVRCWNGCWPPIPATAARAPTAGPGHQAGFVGYRAKTIDTVLGPVQVRRAYYHCADCGHGVVPRDDELGVAGSSLSPGLATMVDRAGAAAPFAKASSLLGDLAGIALTTKRCRRSGQFPIPWSFGRSRISPVARVGCST